jgi:PST family polysaccharide transporter
LSRRDRLTAWWLNVGVALVIAVLLVATAPVLGAALGQPEVAQVLPLYALTLVIASMSSVPLALLQRRMSFGVRAAITLPATCAGAVASIGIALVWPSVWALAAQPLVAAAVTLGILLVRGDVSARLAFDRAAARRMLRFGVPLAGSAMIGVLWEGLPAIILVGTAGAAAAGVYFVADRLRKAIITAVFSALTAVAFPAFSRVAHDRERFGAYVRRAVRASVALSAPVFLIAATQAHNAFELFLGREWQQGASYLSIMLLSAVMYPLNSVNISAMQAAGTTALIFWLEAVKRLLALGALIWALPYGVEAFLWVMLGLAVISYIPNSWFVASRLGYRYTTQLGDVSVPLLIAGVVSGALAALDRVIEVPPAVEIFVFAPVAWLIATGAILAVCGDVRGLLVRAGRR